MLHAQLLKINGLPKQFLVVVVVSAALTIFLGAWAADSRVEARADRFALAGAPSVNVGENLRVAAPSGPAGQPDATGVQDPREIDKQWWESTVLLVCPLH